MPSKRKKDAKKSRNSQTRKTRFSINPLTTNKSGIYAFMDELEQEMFRGTWDHPHAIVEIGTSGNISITSFAYNIHYETLLEKLPLKHDTQALLMFSEAWTSSSLDARAGKRPSLQPDKEEVRTATWVDRTGRQLSSVHYRSTKERLRTDTTIGRAPNAMFNALDCFPSPDARLLATAFLGLCIETGFNAGPNAREAIREDLTRVAESTAPLEVMAERFVNEVNDLAQEEGLPEGRPNEYVTLALSIQPVNTLEDLEISLAGVLDLDEHVLNKILEPFRVAA